MEGSIVFGLNNEHSKGNKTIKNSMLPTAAY